jgi:hypothetical protein
MKRSIIVIIAGLALVILTRGLVTITSDPVYQAATPAYTLSPTTWGQASSEVIGCDQGPSNPPSSATHDLDEDAADWGVYCEGSPAWAKENVAMPSIGGKSLRCSITGGAPYSNVHCYRNLLPEPSSAVFTLTLSFWFSPTTTFNNQGIPSVIQALEFTMNKWHQSKRYEFALQWQNVGDGAPQWRYWDPHQAESWVSLGITDTLEGEQWHTFTLEGEIINGQVHYQRFIIDQQSQNLDISVLPASVLGEPDRLAVAIQLDGNFEETPYDVFIDQVSFVRKPAAQVYLPSVMK